MWVVSGPIAKEHLLQTGIIECEGASGQLLRWSAAHQLHGGFVSILKKSRVELKLRGPCHSDIVLRLRSEELQQLFPDLRMLPQQVEASPALLTINSQFIGALFNQCWVLSLVW